ncbi:protein NRT1/ PTR FAMILY 5.2-like isoform X2 [Asparagus officinalis]|nr:protein NRT1/ PTR FAMILY 5.2-like isoform X2 [Asparagus officinalis]
MCLLTATVSIPSLRPPPCNQNNLANCKPASKLQVGVFFAALYTLALATGGTKPNISTIGADQFDEFDKKERSHKISFFNWWNFSIFLGTLFANVILVYVQDNVGWSLGYGLPTIGLAISLVVFFAGTPFYRHKLPQGSPFTKMARVLLAALRKWRVSLPEDSAELYELDIEEYAQRGKFRIHSTNSLRFLNKAAIKAGRNSPWMLCTVTQVEETKQMLKMIPILIAMFIPAAMIAQVNTLFVKQGTTLNRHTLAMLISIVVYDRYLTKIMRSWTKNPRGISLLQRIGVGLSLHIVIMLVASIVERRRLRFARDHGVFQSGETVPLTIFTLLPQYALMGVSDAFLIVGKSEFFYDQAPESMKSLGTSYSLVTYGIGNFLSSVLLGGISKFTKRGGRHGWILDNLNASHLDYYYALLSALSVFNLVFFVFVSKLYVYKAELYESNEEPMKDIGKGYDEESEI